MGSVALAQCGRPVASTAADLGSARTDSLTG